MTRYLIAISLALGKLVTPPAWAGGGVGREL